MPAVTVVNSALDTSGGGGRKITRLSNGWLVACAYLYPNNFFYKSTDNGQTWSQLCYMAPVMQSANESAGFAITSFGTVVHAIICDTFNGGGLHYGKFDATTQTNTQVTTTNIDPSSPFSFELDSCSLVAHTDGSIHALWTSRVSGYQDFNPRYSVSTDGGASWSTPEKVIGNNTGQANERYHTLVVDEAGIPYIVGTFSNNSNWYAFFLTKKFTNDTTGIANVAPGWGGRKLTPGPGISYENRQSFCLLRKKYGVNVGRLFACWHGLDSSEASRWNLHFVYSDDNGQNWVGDTKITSGTAVDRYNPTLSENTNGDVYIFYQDNASITYQKCANGTASFSGATVLAANGSNPAVEKETANGYMGVIFQDAGAVKFDKLIFNVAPTAPINLTPGNANSATPEIVGTLTPSLSWTFTDPDVGNTQGSRQVQIFNSVGTLIHDTGQIATASTSFVVPGALLAWGQLYSWQVRAWDNSGVVSPYSVLEYIRTNQGPTTTVTVPGATSSAAPTIFNDTNTPGITWTYSDPDGNAQSSFQIDVLNGASQIWTSGEVAGAVTSYTIPGSANLAYDLTYNVRVRSKDVLGSWGAYSALKYFQLNRSPNAPTNLAPGSVSSGSPDIILDNLVPTLSWTFTDADATDTQDAFQVIIEDGTTFSQIRDSGTVSQVVANGAAGSYAVPGGTLISGKLYRWKVRSRDGNIFGAYSVYEYFYTNASPNTPTSPSPAGGSAAAPALINDDTTPRLQWTFGDQNAGDVQASFQIRLYNEAGTLILDTGEVVSASQFYDIQNANKLTYTAKYQWEVRNKDQLGAWSSYTSRGWIQAIIGPPTGLSATSDNFGAQIILDWTDSVVDGLQGYNVYRSTALSGTYTKINGSLVTVSNYADQNVTTGQTYFYKVEAYVSDTQISPQTAAVSAAAVFSAWFIGSFKFEGPTNFSKKRQRIRSKRTVLGKAKQVVQDRGFAGAEMELELYLIEDAYSSGMTKYNDLMAELSKTTPLAVRDPFGRSWNVSPGDFSEQQLMTGKLEFVIRIPLTEVE